MKDWTPARVAPIVGLPEATIVAFARRYGATPATFLRIGIGLSRHDNGAMTCRTLACLPALTGAYADPHGGALLSSGGAAGFDYTVLERPDLMPGPPTRVINMIQLGRALTDPTLAPPVKALYVYGSNPAAICPNQALVLAGLAPGGPVHRGARAGHDRHRALGRPGAAGHHVDGARGRLPLVRPALRAARPAGGAAGGPGPLQLGDVRRARPRARRGRGPLRAAARRRHPRAARPCRSVRAGHHLRAPAGRGLGASRSPAPVPAVRRRRPHHLRPGRVLLGGAGRARPAAAADVGPAAGGAGRGRADSRRAIRCSASCRPTGSS